MVKIGLAATRHAHLEKEEAAVTVVNGCRDHGYFKLLPCLSTFFFIIDYIHIQKIDLPVGA
jgi:hypothetical protein